MSLLIQSVDLDIEREPLVRPFGFKGGAFTEKWVCKATLKSKSGIEAGSVGGLAVLWSDQNVFMSHTETGGNLVMAAMLEYALQSATGKTFTSPPELLRDLVQPVSDYGKSVTGLANLRKTFVYNSLVALDNAAWVLRARDMGITTFDEMLPLEYQKVLDHQHDRLVSVPTISYSMPVDDIRRLVEGGQFVLKVKIGAPGNPSEMLRKDQQRLEAIHSAVGTMKSPFGNGENVRYYLDANGRYSSRSEVESLLGMAEHIGALNQVLLFEEPFPEESEENVKGLPVRFAADESLHDVTDVKKKKEQGFSAIALKPAGKTLSLTLAMAKEAKQLGIPCFVADSSCLPRSLDWNRNVAARLAPLPELGYGLLESNGPESYGNSRWEQLLAAHPCAPAKWLYCRNGNFQLDHTFYESDGGAFESN